MVKFWRVGLYEYLRHVKRRRFLLTLLSMPLFFGLLIAVSVFASTAALDKRPVGFVNQSPDLLIDPSAQTRYSSQVIAFSNEDEAASALSAGEIQGAYIIEPDYLQTGRVRLLSQEQVANDVQSAFRRFLRASLLVGQPSDVSRRLLEGDSLIIRSADESRQFSQDQWLGILLPILSGVLFIVAVNVSGGYLLQAVVEEKENRTIEIIITSVSPNQLMAGKIVGNLSVGLTQLLVWMLFALAGLLLIVFVLPMGQNLTFDSGVFGLTLITLLPAFILVAALMAMIGATVTESREAQQVAGLFTLPIVVPFWFITPIMLNPNSPLAIGLSLFPLTAPISLPLRAAFTNLPAWQIALSLCLLVASAFGAVWLAGRAFRLGMLRYGKRLSWKELFGKA